MSEQVPEEFVLAADLGGTNIRVAAVGCDGRVLRLSRCRTPSVASAEGIAAAIAKLAEEACSFTDRRVKPLAFGLAVPALVDSANGVTISAPNLPQLDGVPFASMIGGTCGLPVALENDANAAAAGEHWLGASRNVATSVCVTLGTGVGGGIMLNGRLWRGIDGTAGEIGHICVEPEGAPCGCGGNGCVEQYSSATAVVRVARELKSEFPVSTLQTERITSLDVYNAAKAGDPLALEVFRRAGSYLGIALASLVNTLNPEAIVIGGGAAAGFDLLIEHISSEVRQRAFRRPAERVKLVPASLGDLAGLLGSARLAFDAHAEGQERFCR